MNDYYTPITHINVDIEFLMKSDVYQSSLGDMFTRHNILNIQAEVTDALYELPGVGSVVANNYELRVFSSIPVDGNIKDHIGTLRRVMSAVNSKVKYEPVSFSTSKETSD